EPLFFEMRTSTAPKLIDSRGRLIKTVIAKELSEAEQREREANSHRREDKILATMLEDEGASIGDIAKIHGLSKSVVHRALKRLEEDKLVKNRRGRYEVTREGASQAKEIAELRNEHSADGTAERAREHALAGEKQRSGDGTRSAREPISTGRSRRNERRNAA